MCGGCGGSGESLPVEEVGRAQGPTTNVWRKWGELYDTCGGSGESLRRKWEELYDTCGGSGESCIIPVEEVGRAQGHPGL